MAVNINFLAVVIERLLVQMANGKRSRRQLKLKLKLKKTSPSLGKTKSKK